MPPRPHVVGALRHRRVLLAQTATRKLVRRAPRPRRTGRFAVAAATAAVVVVGLCSPSSGGSAYSARFHGDLPSAGLEGAVGGLGQVCHVAEAVPRAGGVHPQLHQTTGIVLVNPVWRAVFGRVGTARRGGLGRVLRVVFPTDRVPDFRAHSCEHELHGPRVVESRARRRDQHGLRLAVRVCRVVLSVRAVRCCQDERAQLPSPLLKIVKLLVQERPPTPSTQGLVKPAIGILRFCAFK
mmetsp:Transcript_31981/g.65121  ORF Transcript_31981/g.65121 Transcript_31981/m.65121 type:complete len:239 (-) Transcript_31981:233-949(-)